METVTRAPTPVRPSPCTMNDAVSVVERALRHYRAQQQQHAFRSATKPSPQPIATGLPDRSERMVNVQEGTVDPQKIKELFSDEGQEVEATAKQSSSSSEDALGTSVVRFSKEGCNFCSASDKLWQDDPVPVQRFPVTGLALASLDETTDPTLRAFGAVLAGKVEERDEDTVSGFPFYVVYVRAKVGAEVHSLSTGCLGNHRTTGTRIQQWCDKLEGVEYTAERAKHAATKEKRVVQMQAAPSSDAWHAFLVVAATSDAADVHFRAVVTEGFAEPVVSVRQPKDDADAPLSNERLFDKTDVRLSSSVEQFLREWLSSSLAPLEAELASDAESTDPEEEDMIRAAKEAVDDEGNGEDGAVEEEDEEEGEEDEEDEEEGEEDEEEGEEDEEEGEEDEEDEEDEEEEEEDEDDEEDEDVEAREAKKFLRDMTPPDGRHEKAFRAEATTDVDELVRQLTDASDVVVSFLSDSCDHCVVYRDEVLPHMGSLRHIEVTAPGDAFDALHAFLRGAVDVQHTPAVFRCVVRPNGDLYTHPKCAYLGAGQAYRGTAVGEALATEMTRFLEQTSLDVRVGNVRDIGATAAK